MTTAFKPDRITTAQGQTIIPNDIKSQLPIFSLIGDKLPEAVKSPEAKKTMSTLLFWSLLLGGTLFFFKNIGTLLEYAQQTTWFVIYAISALTLIGLAPKIIGFLNRIGKTLLFKGEKAFVGRNPIASLQLLMQDAKDTLKKVRDKITQAEGVKNEMITNAHTSNKEAEEGFTLLKRLTEQAGELDKQAIEADKAGNKEKANRLRREANETRSTALLRKSEAETSSTLAKQYAQYGNQFSKVVEVLKDNESGAKIYVSTLNSSIKIIESKLSATNKMRSATEGLADVFNIKDGWVFQTAIDAATSQISYNLASIKRNLDFVEQNQTIQIGKVSQAELEASIKSMDSNLQTLNIQEITDASHELTQDQKVDKGFNLLD